MVLLYAMYSTLVPQNNACIAKTWYVIQKIYYLKMKLSNYYYYYHYLAIPVVKYTSGFVRAGEAAPKAKLQKKKKKIVREALNPYVIICKLYFFKDISDRNYK